MISKLDDELSSNLTSLYSNAENYAYEEEIYNLVNRELKDFFGTEKWGDYITSQIRKVDGTVVNRETFRVDVTNLLKRIVPEYIDMHVTEPDNQFEYQGNLENVIKDWFNETEDYLDFRIPEYPDYRLLEKQINDLYSDYI
jgi:deoxyadenosine/deoxycytidine kinase